MVTKFPLCALACRIPAGHRLRIALSTSYWPIAWPSPGSATISLATGTSTLALPVRAPRPAVDDALAPFAEPEGAAPTALVELRARETSQSQDRIEEHLGEGGVDLTRTRDRGAWRTTETDVAYDTTGELRFSIRNDDPLSATQHIALGTTLGRPGWETRTQAETRLSCTVAEFLLQARLQAWHGEDAVFDRSWDLRIPRDQV